MEEVDPYRTPLVPPPPGQESNFVNPLNHAHQYYIVAGICTGLMTLLVLVRLYIRFLVTHTPWWDDITVVFALLSQCAYTGVIIKEGDHGLGRHAWDVTIADFEQFDRYARPSAILTAPAIYFTKLTLLLLYLRLFLMNRPVKIGIWAGIAFCTAYYTAALFLNIFLTEQRTLLRLTYSVAVVGVVTDVYIIMLPLFAIAQLHLSRAKKWRVAAVFLTGLLGVIMSFLGCVYRFQLDLMDSTYSVLSIYIVNTVEVDIGIICTCLPLLGVLFNKSVTKRESWWLTSFRSLRNRLFSTRGSAFSSPSGSHGSRAERSTVSGGPRALSRHGPYKNGKGHSEDDIELAVRTSVDHGSLERGGGTRTVVVPPDSKAIWCETRIEQRWGGDE